MQEFVAYSENAKQALKSAHLIKNLSVNTLIIGSEGSGKKSLASHIEDTKIVSAKNIEMLKELLKSSTSLIIDDFETITNHDALDFSDKKIVALSSKELPVSLIDRFFAVVIRLNDLNERPEDIKPLADLFLKDAKEALGATNIEIEYTRLDISKNAISLKRSIYFELFKKSLAQPQIEEILEEFFADKIKGISAYRELLPIFERALLKKGLEIHKSQLKLSEILGLNRNTIRKKIKECGLNYEE